MNEDVARVVSAARALRAAMATGRPALMEEPTAEFNAAIEALDARDNATRSGESTMEEMDRTWGEVVVQDHILSGKTGKWYEVSSTSVNERAGTIRVLIKGSTKPIVRPLGEPVKLKRGVMGEAADMLTILWSR